MVCGRIKALVIEGREKGCLLAKEPTRARHYIHIVHTLQGHSRYMIGPVGRRDILYLCAEY